MASKAIKMKDSNGNLIYPCPYYPVGSIYLSVNDVNPTNFFGGVWEQIKDTFLLACGDTYFNGAVGGESTHTLTNDEMPSHTHNQNAHNHGTSGGGNWEFGAVLSGGVSRRQVGSSGTNRGYAFTTDSTSSNSALAFNAKTGSTTATNQNTGGGQAHNNMPPYLAVYMWKRTA